MKSIHLTNSMIYSIPDDVKYATCSIAISDMESDAAKCDVWELEREAMFKRNKDALVVFRHIGCEERKRIGGTQVELHWFIWKIDLPKCSVRPEERSI